MSMQCERRAAPAPLPRYLGCTNTISLDPYVRTEAVRRCVTHSAAYGLFLRIWSSTIFLTRRTSVLNVSINAKSVPSASASKGRFFSLSRMLEAYRRVRFRTVLALPFPSGPARAGNLSHAIPIGACLSVRDSSSRRLLATALTTIFLSSCNKLAYRFSVDGKSGHRDTEIRERTRFARNG